MYLRWFTVNNGIQELIKLKNSKEWIEFENYYTQYNIFNQFDYFRFEDIHTNILKSLFERDNVYGLGTYSLKRLIELLTIKDEEKTNINIEELNKYELENINVKSQEIIDNNRLDLLINFNLNNQNYNIVLENKVFSSEHDNQCERYYQYFMKNKNINSNKTNYIFVYLSLEKNPEFSCKENYIKIGYQELVDYVIEPCSYKAISNSRIISLDTYLSSFSCFYDYIDNCYDIPITNHGMELTIKLYNKYNKTLIEFIKNKDEFYKKNRKVLDPYYYNLHKLLNNKILNDNESKQTIDRNLLNIRCTFKGEKTTYNKCYLLIVKYLFDLNIIRNTDDLDKLNSCELNNNYVVASPNFDSLHHKDYYHLSDNVIGCLCLNNKNLYYYVGSIRKDELKYFVEEVNKKFNNVLSDEIVKIN